MNKTKIRIVVFSLIIMIIGIIMIYFFADRHDRPMFVILLGAILLIVQQVIIRFVSSKKESL